MVEKSLSGTSVSQSASLPAGGIAVVIGASGGIGQALALQLATTNSFSRVLGYARSTTISLDLTLPSTIEAVAADIERDGGDLRLVINATGILEGEGCVAEKTFRQLDAADMARAFAINAIGPALLMKHMLPLPPRSGRSVFATLSARVGSISDNRLGGWYISTPHLRHQPAQASIRGTDPENFYTMLHTRLHGTHGFGRCAVRSKWR